MSVEARELIELCERLSAAERAEVADFARFVLARNAAGASQGAMERWLASARGAAKPRVTTDEVMAWTRGEP
jgi:hypothetical protein